MALHINTNASIMVAAILHDSSRIVISSVRAHCHAAAFMLPVISINKMKVKRNKVACAPAFRYISHFIIINLGGTQKRLNSNDIFEASRIFSDYQHAFK